MLESVFNRLIAGGNAIIILGAGNIYDLIVQFLNKLKR